MGSFSKVAAICMVVLTFYLQACAGQNRLSVGESILPNQTLVSEQGDFALGFFRPDNSSANLYVGIWYNRIPQRTVVWVANRENPLKDPSGSLTITAERNVALLDARGRVLWSSDVPNPPSSTHAVLLDTGNLVLQAGDADNATIWQSFEHPTDTWIPEMSMLLNVTTGVGSRLVSWKSKTDPSPGDFSLGIDPETSLQLKIWRGSETWVRGSLWREQIFGVGRVDSTAFVLVQRIEYFDGMISAYVTTTKASSPARAVISSTGLPILYIWVQSLGKWYESPTTVTPCTFYNRCGPNGICDGNATSLRCSCLDGFVPKTQKDWGMRNFSGGCIRRVPLTCHGGEGFMKLSNIKLPDGARLLRNASSVQCEAECLANCSCTGYAYSNASVIGSSSRCLVWTTQELNDLLQYINSSTGGEDLYLRLAASELGDNVNEYGSSRVKNILLATVLPLSAVAFILTGVFGYLQIKKIKRRGRRTVLFDDFRVSDLLGNEGKAAKLPALDFDDLLAATNNFSSANKLGEGGFGPVYKGTLHQGQEVAVKTLSRGSGQGFEEFKNEVELIAKLQHTNLVRLLGWCIHDNEKMLIYEYMPNQSLDKLIFDPLRKAELDWAKRFVIIQGIAQGLLYLHRYSRMRVIHRDLKTSNILLDEDMTPKISDFGLARIFEKTQTEANTKRVVGTLGYMPPEYAFYGLISEKSDVFGFGVMLLEIVSGRRSTDLYPYMHSYNLLGYAWELWKEGRSLELTDASMGSEFSIPEVSRCIQVALLCVEESASDRPTMPYVVSMLSTDIAALPSPKQPAFATERNCDHMETSSQGFLSESLRESTSSDIEIDDIQ